MGAAYAEGKIRFVCKLGKIANPVSLYTLDDRAGELKEGALQRDVDRRPKSGKSWWHTAPIKPTRIFDRDST